MIENNNDECWLPELIACEDLANWAIYEERLYKIFKNDFIDDAPFFLGKRVQIRYHPKENNRENAFYHVTCREFVENNDRLPDTRRCERILWIRAFIENYDACLNKHCLGCEGVKSWREPYRSNYRRYFLLKEKRYVVILEERPKYHLLITAFWIEYEHTLKKLLKRYEQYREK